MRYLKLSFEYIKKNFLYLLPLVLIPAILVGAGTEPCSMIQFFMDFNLEEYQTFGSIFLAQSEVTWWAVLGAVLILPIIIASLSGLCGVITRHMRYGIIGYDKLYRRVNYNFLPVLKISLVILVGLQLYAVVCTSLTLLWTTVIKDVTVALSLTIVTNLVLLVALFFCMVIAFFILPSMCVSGLSFRTAIAESAHIIKRKFFSILLAIVLPLIIPYIIMGVLAAFDLWWRRIINPFIYIFFFMYYISLMFTAYFDIEDIDREDIKDKFLID